MKREKKKASDKQTEAPKKVALSSTLIKDERVNTADTNDTSFENMTEFANKLSGFGRHIKSETTVENLMAEPSKWTVVVPSNILSLVSFKYSCEDLKKFVSQELPKGTIHRLTFTGNSVRLFINKEKLADLPDETQLVNVDNKNLYSTKLIDDCHRSLMAKLNLNKFPRMLSDMALKDGEFKLTTGSRIIMDLDSRKFIVNRVLPSIVTEESIKGYPLSNIELTNVLVEGDYLFFALTFKSVAVADSITIHKQNFVAANYSMSHDKFKELAKTYLDISAPGARVEFVNTKSLTDNLSGANVDIAKKSIQTNGFKLNTTPVINIEEAKSLYKKESGNRVFKNPLLKLTASMDSDHVAFDMKQVESKLSAVLDKDTLRYSVNGATVVLPNVKKLILASLHDGEIPTNLRVSYSTSNANIGFAVSV